MKKNQIVTFRVDRMDSLQESVGMYENKLVYVKGALPGQQVEVRISRNREQHAEGKLLRVLEASEQEVPSFCTHYGACGGCSLQTLPYEVQLEL
jgi:tRNA/tmRNA/rRNA uracil-C5-methylase (TrmA/RlmC/RlmD family)